MRAVIAERYGPPSVLRLAELPKPKLRDCDVMIRVHAATVSMGDCELRAFKIADWAWLPLRLIIGVTRPRQPVLGQEIAGLVVETGDGVVDYSVGDRVFGSTGFSMGGYAEFKAMSSSGSLTRIPSNLTYNQAAGIPIGAINAEHLLRHPQLQAGERVLINGAGGSIGTFAVQFAKSIGAHVTAVDRTDKLEMLSRLGADQTIDYTRVDFWSVGQKWDVIVDIVGSSNFSGCIRSLSANGRYMLGNPRLWSMIRGMWVSRTTGKTVLFKPAGETREALQHVAECAASGEVEVVIDRCFPLESAADAHSYVERGEKKGVVIIDVAGGSSHAQ